MKKLFKNHDLIKIIGVAILLAFVLTWLIPSGAFSGAEFVDYGLNRTGIYNFFLTGVYSVNYFILQLTLLLVLGGFYALISKTDGYKNLVAKVVKFVKGKEIPFIMVVSFVLAFLGSMSSDGYQLLVFVPFLITVMLNAKMDKITAFSVTFGAILIGNLGATFGGAGVAYFNQYLGSTFDKLIYYKIAIFFVAYLLFSLFTILRLRRTLKSKKEETTEDRFAVEVKEVKTKTKKSGIVPIIVIFSLLFIFMVLGYIDWAGVFKIDVFAKFHTWLTEFTIGDHAIFAYILGKTPELGTWDLFGIQFILFLLSIVVIIINKMKLDDILETFAEGVRKMAKPAFIVFLVNVCFIFVYSSQFMPTVVNWILGSLDKFNVYLTGLTGILTGIFHTDFAFTGYTIGAFLSGTFADSTSIASVVFSSTNGLVSLIVPTSAVLMAGLAYLGIEYKAWFKHIWKFIVGMLGCLLIIYTLMVYL